MWTLWVHHTAPSARSVARLVTNRIASRIHRHRRAFVQVAALLPLDSRNDDLRREHYGVRLRFHNNRLGLSNHGFLAEVARTLRCGERINLRALGAFWCRRFEGTNLVAQLDHHLRLRWQSGEARLDALVLDGSLEERREFSYRPKAIVAGQRLRLLAIHRCDLLIITVIVIENYPFVRHDSNCPGRHSNNSESIKGYLPSLDKLSETQKGSPYNISLFVRVPFGWRWANVIRRKKSKDSTECSFFLSTGELSLITNVNCLPIKARTLFLLFLLPARAEKSTEICFVLLNRSAWEVEAFIIFDSLVDYLCAYRLAGVEVTGVCVGVRC